MPTELASLLLQTGMVGVFIWYSIISNKAHAEVLKAQTEVWQKLLDGERAERQARDSAWQILMSDDRVQRKEIADRHQEYFGRIHELSMGIEKLATALGSHDANAQLRQMEVMEAVAELRQMVSSP